MAQSLDPDLAWDEYKLLEENFIEYLRYVPLSSEHFKVWSLNLGDLLIRTSSIIDSFFKRAMFSSELDTANRIKWYRTLDDEKINMAIHQQIFENFYDLSSKRIYEIRKSNSFIPFSNWNSNDSPDWWKAYNHVKHDRFKNKKEATLEATINALSALFILNVIHFETMPVLVDYDIIKSNLSKGAIKCALKEKEPLSTVEPIYAKTNLFGYVFNAGYEPDYEYYLSRSYPGY